MPYIPKEKRVLIDPEIEELISNLRYRKADVGMLNYTISRLLKTWWEFDPCYKTGNDIMGVMDCAKSEFYRRTLSPYEDKKIQENGDI